MKYNLHSLCSFCFTTIIATIMIGCSSTDCPLNNTVNIQANFYRSSTGALTNITDTLSIIGGGRLNKTILNRVINTYSLTLPVGYVQTVDTLLFHFITNAGEATDSILIAHTNEPHFVSLDCSTAFFHTITSVKYLHPRKPTSDFPTAIDSIVVNTPQVNYDQTENLQIYFSTY